MFLFFTGFESVETKPAPNSNEKDSNWAHDQKDDFVSNASSDNSNDLAQQNQLFTPGSSDSNEITQSPTAEEVSGVDDIGSSGLSGGSTPVPQNSQLDMVPPIGLGGSSNDLSDPTGKNGLTGDGGDMDGANGRPPLHPPRGRVAPDDMEPLRGHSIPMDGFFANYENAFPGSDDFGNDLEEGSPDKP